jgi:hypothetical protein
VLEKPGLEGVEGIVMFLPSVPSFGRSQRRRPHRIFMSVLIILFIIKPI